MNHCSGVDEHSPFPATRTGTLRHAREAAAVERAPPAPGSDSGSVMLDLPGARPARIPLLHALLRKRLSICAELAYHAPRERRPLEGPGPRVPGSICGTGSGAATEEDEKPSESGDDG